MACAAELLQELELGQEDIDEEAGSGQEDEPGSSSRSEPSEVDADEDAGVDTDAHERGSGSEDEGGEARARGSKRRGEGGEGAAPRGKKRKLLPVEDEFLHLDEMERFVAEAEADEAAGSSEQDDEPDNDLGNAACLHM